MRFRHVTSGCSILILGTLSGCGGGNSGSSVPVVTVPGTGSPAPTATLPVTLSASSANVTVDEGQATAFGFTATYTGSTPQPVVADVTIGSKRYVLEGTPTASGTSFAVSLKPTAFNPGGREASTVTFRLCTSANCATVYPGSTVSFAVSLDVRLKDWGTFQRDAAHTGYVAAKYKTTDFATAWSMPSRSPYAPTPIAARRGRVFVNMQPQNASANPQTLAIDSLLGAVDWAYDVGHPGYFSAPSYANGRLIYATRNLLPGTVGMDVLDADGIYRLSLPYASQFATAGTTTALDDNVYYAAGDSGNEIYSYDAATGVRQWVANAFPSGSGIVREGESVAADENFVYFFSAGSLFALSRTNGAIVHSIRNPFFSSGGLSYSGLYYGGPILDGSGRVFTFSDNRNKGQALSLVAFSINSDSVLWHSSRSYAGEPALRDGKLYAIRANSAVVDIIDTANGSVTSSIDLGADKGILSSNVVVTGSHLFVASDTATYAVDLEQSGYPTVWSARHGGSLAITPDNLLVVAALEGLYAYRLA